jgi:flagellum-specific peptidoglycan hydrolase FlgJ
VADGGGSTNGVGTSSFAEGTVVLSEMQANDYELTQEQVTNFLSSYSLLEHLDTSFYTQGNSLDIDPAFAVAVAVHETAGGTSELFNNCKNLFGIKATTNACDYNNEYQGYTTQSNSINDFYALIGSNIYIGAGKKTPAQIGSVYAEDPNWASLVIGYRNQVIG